MRESFIRVLEEFNSEVQKPLAQNPLANFLRHEFPELVQKNAYISNQYKVKGSPGAGNWAEIPWIAILDKDITDTPEKQFYIVYLFDGGMDGVHLSLNQGWKQYEIKFGNNQPAAREAIRIKTMQLQETLKSSYDFFTAPISLHAKNNLGKGYELGHICGKYYPKAAIPSDQQLIDDLRNLIGVYREMKAQVGKDILGIPQTHQLEIPKEEISKLRISAAELELSKADAASARKYSTNVTVLFNEEIEAGNQKEYKRIGKKAELVVAEFERKHLIEIGRPDLAEKIKVVSENMANGYDILSFDDSGTPKQIEVKGTRSNEHLFFTLTAYELAASKALPNYYLYHVHRIDSGEPGIGYIKHPVFESEKFCLEPKQFLVKYKLVG